MNPNADKILAAAIELVRQEPERLRMDIWALPCGTVGCLAYQVLRAVGATLPDLSPGSRAQNFIGINSDQAAELFLLSNPYEADEYADAVNAGRKVEWLEDHVRRFLERHGGQTLDT